MTTDEKLDCLIMMMRDVSHGLHALDSTISCGFDKYTVSAAISLIATNLDSALNRIDSSDDSCSDDNGRIKTKKSFWR